MNDPRGPGTAPAALTLEQAARKTPPAALSDTEAMIDLARMRRYRLNRVREQLVQQEIAACVLFSPLSIR